MIFIIDNYVTYDESAGIITHAGTNDFIALPATAARILSFILMRQGETLTREQILEHVWEQYGFKASNNTLAQYISLIRKAFHTLGVSTDIIVTIPRAGFILSKEIDVTVKNEQVVEQSVALPGADSDARQSHFCLAGAKDFEPVKISEPVFQSTLSIHPDREKKDFIYSAPLILMILLSALAWLAMVVMFFNQKYDFQRSEKIYLLGKIDTCPIYLLNASSAQTAEKKLQIAQRVSATLLPCWKGTIFYVQPEDSLIYGDGGRVFIARCSYSNDNPKEFSDCKNISAYFE